MYKIPLKPLPAQAFSVVLEETTCHLAVYTRGDHLYLDLSAGQETVCVGAICRNGANILQFPHPAFKGTLHFWDTRGSSAPKWEDLGERYLLIYCEPGEVIPDAFC